ncbi:MAG TPA: pyruvate carboxylase subunit B [Candidatus Dormibacteraeota bacterium]|jgi:pyruvate carboxylase subunit B|nr:pyruvate carboxylase subunit B [Candidatus Dormibacteraeota bacterium]
MPRLELIETSLRHGQQALLLSRLRRRHILPVAELLDRCGFAALDVFGGATFEAALRFLAEDPFERLRAIREAAPQTPLLALLRGQALVGHRQVADDVVDAFIAAAAEAGVDVFRCYDSLNDPRNLQRCVVAAHAAGRRAEGGIVYTESPVHDVEGFVKLGGQLKDLGYDALGVYDPAGLLGAGTASALVSGLVAETGLPVNVHSAALTGQAGLAYLAAAEAGAASVDVALSPLASGSSLPAAEGVLNALRGTPHETGLDLDAVAAAAARLDDYLGYYTAIADPAAWRLDTSVLRTQLPPTAVEHLFAELRDRDALERLPQVQEEIPRVRAELGYPPLITPIAQIVATQAVYNVCDGDRYATISQEVKDYCLGLYGEPPGKVDPEVRRIVNGREEPITCRPADLLEPAMAGLRREMQREGIPVRSDADVAAYALFPADTAALLRGEATAELLGDEPAPEPAAPLELSAGDDAAELAAADGAGAPEAAAPPAPPEETRELTVEVDGEQYQVRVTAPAGTFGAGGGANGGGSNGVAAGGGKPVIKEGTVVAPMQGLILKVSVGVGDTVKLGEVVAVLEAMKMQNDIVASRDGTVREIYVAEGKVVSPKDPILLVE